MQEIAAALNVEKPAADGLVKYLLAVGLAQFGGERPNPTGRGKGAHVYKIPTGAGEKLGLTIAKLEE